MDIIFIEEEEEKEDVEKMRELIIHSPFLSPFQGRREERERELESTRWLALRSISPLDIKNPKISSYRVHVSRTEIHWPILKFCNI